MSGSRIGSLLLLVVVTISCSSPAPSGPTPVVNVPGSASATASAESGDTSGTMAATPSSATVQFGLVDVGNGVIGHPSGHANDTLVPGTVVIDQGGTVTFNIPRFSPHMIAIYGPGKGPKDVDTSSLVVMPTGCPGQAAGVPLRIDDDDLRVWEYVAPDCFPPSETVTTPNTVFTEPGRYLVICTFDPHFQIGMYGWVTVRRRDAK
jgi:plastocyanin